MSREGVFVVGKNNAVLPQNDIFLFNFPTAVMMDDVRVYSKALATAEIQKHYYVEDFSTHPAPASN